MSQYTFSPEQTGMQSPKEWYLAAQNKPGFIHDASQARAIEALDHLWHQLVEFKNKRNRFLGRSLRSPEVPKGIYLWGGVGRGKSFLMDAFYSCVSYKRKRRIHFHHFMTETQRQLQALSGQDDPLIRYAEQIAKQTRLLCFDEFHVSDIADAMILGRLLSALFERGVVLVATSNYPPDGLYTDGLQRDNFLPTIALINKHLDVINVDSGNDYRLRELTREPLFIVPADEAAEAKLETLFLRLSHGQNSGESVITVLDRSIPVKKRFVNGVIWFDFMALCHGPRSQADYLDIASVYHTVLISNIPKLGAKEASIARRFTWLVDVFYDSRVKLIASAEVLPEALYTEGIQANEFSRTVSRLMEMQTESYLALPHQITGDISEPSVINE